MDAHPAAQTRLLELSTMRLRNFPVNRMPPYLAISHVWSEESFSSIYLDRDRHIVRDCQGIDMLRAFLHRRPRPPQIQYCWADTWCIDQNDPTDKARQIPLMYNIYKEARFVVVVIKHLFSFSQRDWDVVCSNLQQALAYEQDISKKDGPEALAYYCTPEASNNLNAAAEMIEELVSVPWFERIWTAQEYILARDIFWLGLDHASMHFDLEQLRSILLIHDIKLSSGLQRQQSVKSLSNAAREIWMLTAIRKGDLSPTNAMHLACNRRCSFPEDEIYGLMAASGVVIAPRYGIDLEKVWQTWWEKAIIENQIMWIMMSTSNPALGELFKESDNCIRPHSESRFSAFAASGLSTIGIRPYAPLELNQGTVSILGRVAGKCKVEMYLGEFEDLEGSILDGAVPELFSDFETFVKLFIAISSGTNRREKIETYAKWIYEQRSTGNGNQPRFNRAEHPDDEYNTRVGKGSRPQGDRGHRSSERAQESHYLDIKQNLPLPGRLYLTTIESRLASTVFVVNAAGIPQGGHLLAVDVGISVANPKEDPYRYEEKPLIVVHVPKGVDPASDTLHKVGITSPVFVPEVSSGGFDKFERAKAYCGLVIEDEYEWLRIGGDSCSYCHPSRMNNVKQGNGIYQTTSRKRKRQSWGQLDQKNFWKPNHMSRGKTVRRSARISEKEERNKVPVKG